MGGTAADKAIWFGAKVAANYSTRVVLGVMFWAELVAVVRKWNLTIVFAAAWMPNGKPVNDHDRAVLL